MISKGIKEAVGVISIKKKKKELEANRIKSELTAQNKGVCHRTCLRSVRVCTASGRTQVWQEGWTRALQSSVRRPGPEGPLPAWATPMQASPLGPLPWGPMILQQRRALWNPDQEELSGGWRTF